MSLPSKSDEQHLHHTANSLSIDQAIKPYKH